MNSAELGPEPAEPPEDSEGTSAEESGAYQRSDEVAAPKNKPAKNSAGKVFGAEGTNKTLPEPQAAVDESEVEPGGQGKYVSPTPYKRNV